LVVVALVVDDVALVVEVATDVLVIGTGAGMLIVDEDTDDDVSPSLPNKATTATPQIAATAAGTSHRDREAPLLMGSADSWRGRAARPGGGTGAGAVGADGATTLAWLCSVKARAKALQEVNRFCGFFAKAACSTASRAASSGRLADTGGGSALR